MPPASRPTARCRLQRRAAGEIVTIEIADDGRGIDAARVAARARQARPRRAAGRLDDARAARPDLLAGLLDARRVRPRQRPRLRHGRGPRRRSRSSAARCGMTTEPGKGTRFIIELPLTLAITDALIARVGDRRPSRCRRPRCAKSSRSRRRRSARSKAARSSPFRGAALPVVRLSAALGIAARRRDAHARVRHRHRRRRRSAWSSIASSASARSSCGRPSIR